MSGILSSNGTNFTEIVLPRSQWAVALAAIDRARVTNLARLLTEKHSVRPVSVTQAGLALLPLRETVEREVFYLGEIPLSRSHVEITASSGETVEGGASVMADDGDLADALAICDGILVHRLDGWGDIAALVAEGSETLRLRARVRQTMQTRSRVHFSLLNQDDDFDSDNKDKTLTNGTGTHT